ncbi:MFS transporter [Curvibacter sp. PAE-UM]|uniref:MFS transporter n=1 Tax=Curvibacter sp. PAE-UM TaxID=1714344 RepID=UPI000708CA93|nr:MFS transporter [Curvibacter sp. PAE-UM]KRH99401.1 MFS transporter [Curvibacter sp. PAE-UM]
MNVLSRRGAVLVFLAFAFAYFFSALIRAITATLSPQLTQEFSLHARDLGLLAGGYFLGFAAMQLPLGRWLDRQGPKTVILGFLAVAAIGCLAFSQATSFSGLLVARVLCGIGLAACLMAPLTGFRRWLDPASQLRANSWMLMTGSMGMVASTLPVQWLLPDYGWRPLFWGLAAMLLLSMVVIAWQVPRWQKTVSAPVAGKAAGSYTEVWRHAYFRRLTPLGFFNYGGMVAIQTLWAVPWMTRVAGYTPVQAATSLFWINVAMLATFWSWGLLIPRLTRRGVHTNQLIAWGTPLSLLLLAIIVMAGESGARHAGLLWALFCVSSTFLSLAQPAVGMAFPAELAGRALSAYNLVIFAGVFVVQWGIGLLIDAFAAQGWAQVQAFQGALAVFLLLNLLSYLYFLVAKKT